MQKGWVVLLFFFAVVHSTERNPGDTLWNACQNISTPIGTLRNVCVKLEEGQDCAVVGQVSVAGSVLFEQELSLGITPEICGNYQLCDMCVSFQSDPRNQSQECATAGLRCGSFNPVTQTLGCFSNSVLQSIDDCLQRDCLNSCSHHGTCVDSKCVCDSGYYGEDCSSTDPIFCTRLSDLSGNVCVKLSFEACNIIMTVTVQGFTIYTQEYPISQFRSVFQYDGTCFDALGCSVCVGWGDLTITESSASGCGVFNFSCSGINYGPIQLGCFTDDEITSDCFGPCPNDCSNHGTCDLGECTCYTDYGGDDCSVTQKCPKDCNSHGACTDGVCNCFDGYYGTDCSDSDSNSGSGKSGDYVWILVVLALIVVGVASGVGVWLYLRRKRGRAQFHHFDLLESEPEEKNAGEETKEDS